MRYYAIPIRMALIENVTFLKDKASCAVTVTKAGGN
jgi:hypothetical protein